MVDNIDVDPGTGSGKVPVATDDVAGVQYQIIKIATGADGVATNLSNAAPLPISDAGGSITVDGTVAVTGTVTASGTVAATQSGAWTVTANVGTGTQPVSGTVAATQSGTWNIAAITTLPALPAGTNNIGDVDVLTLPVQFGAGAVTGTTQRVTIDTGQVGSLVAGGVPTVSGGYEYETVAVSQTNQALGATGATGDYIEGLLCVVATAATSQVQIKDGGGTAITVLPNNVGAGIGSYYVPLGLVSTGGAWQVTTAAGVTVIATGSFT